MNHYPNGTPVAPEISVSEQKKYHYLSVGELKKILEKIDDDTLIAIHRIEDSYFKSFGNNGWHAIKALWETGALYPGMEEWIKNPNECDTSLYEIGKDDKGNEVLLHQYIDAIPAFQAFVSTEKGPEKQKVLVITPHY